MPRTHALRPMLLALGCFSLAACSGPEPRPNVVLLIADDQDYADFGFMGSEWVETPNLDRLAADGVVFELAHNTASYCKPSLNTLLTGLHPLQWRSRVTALREASGGSYPGFAIEHFPTLPRLLSEHGYATFQAGKYWEGSYAAGGFDEGMTAAFDRDVPHGGAGITIGRETMEPVERFIEANGDRPFFLWFAPMLPHLPHDAPERYRAGYEGRGLAESAVAYYAACSWFDDVAGQLLRFLEERGLAQNTLVVFLSDNGWDQRPFEEHTGFQRLMGGARGKHSFHDRGMRTPIVFHQPGAIPPRRIPDQLASTTDLLPTILDYAGVPVPEGLPGTSLRPVIEGREVLSRPFLIGSAERLRPQDGPPDIRHLDEFETRSHEVLPRVDAFYLRSRDWHYLHFEDRDREALYDLRSDPEEEHDVSAQHPERVAGFRAEIERWRREATAP